MAMELLKTEKAPRPLKRSYSRSLYDALTSLSGPATVEQISAMLPATDDAGKWQTNTPDRVTQLLKSAESHGYVQYNTFAEKWQIGTKAHYELKQAHIAELRLRTDTERLKPGPLKAMANASVESVNMSLKSVLIVVTVGWIGGIVTTLATIGALGALGGQ